MFGDGGSWGESAGRLQLRLVPSRSRYDASGTRASKDHHRIEALTALTAAIIVSLGSAQAQRTAPQGYITGVVRSSQGPEAGVWVIAETKDLPTNFIKIVVTDDQGRFMIARAARRELQRLGPGLRPGRLDAGG